MDDVLLLLVGCMLGKQTCNVSTHAENELVIHKSAPNTHTHSLARHKTHSPLLQCVVRVSRTAAVKLSARVTCAVLSCRHRGYLSHTALVYIYIAAYIYW